MAGSLVVVVLSVILAPIHGISPDETLPEYLGKYGIHVEEHSVTTDDKYILGMFRMPRPGAPVVLFMPGILASSWCFLDNDPAISPAIQMYDLGYDVWLPNNRGNTYSRKHETLQPLLSKQFWDFSFPEMGVYDTPASINYVINATGKPTLTYIGHSEGTSQFFVAMTDNRTKALVEQRVNLFVALAPVAYLSHPKSLLIKAMSTARVGEFVMATFPFGFLQFSAVKNIAHFLCTATFGLLCEITVATVGGVSKEDTPAAITNFSAHFPAGTSVKAVEHYAQFAVNGKFQDFDYGCNFLVCENMKVYGQKTPPAFDLSKARVPTALFVGGNDALGDTTDAARLAKELPNSTVVFNEVFPDYSHATWLVGTPSSFHAWFPKLTSLLSKYNPLAFDIVV